ncbi:MarR family transcriptional regulator [Lachnospiraceae bacterium WCA-9-b2]|jgi:DNA-binding MarR family transcriptional regulator|uniref:MarR family transcriptional regulator n=1 Tax=Sporofaciens musculi TaxID=2681861 RepID=A0A7X3MJ90_9FIRM|nr:MarR family transcriptional regulator [Sporofaciens musculi]MXP77377.1 MarR family transcriptional regulator [Sporofaciens musculi]
MKNIEDARVFIVMHQLMHLSRYQAVRRMEDMELNPSQAGILFILNNQGRLSQRQLAEKIGITPPSMTVTLRKLEERGFITKEPDERDQRILRICLSEAGKECIEKIKSIMKDMEEILYRGFSVEERLLFQRLLLEMRENMLDSKDFKGMDFKTIIEKTGPPMGHDF